MKCLGLQEPGPLQAFVFSCCWVVKLLGFGERSCLQVCPLSTTPTEIKYPNSRFYFPNVTASSFPIGTLSIFSPGNTLQMPRRITSMCTSIVLHATRLHTLQQIQLAACKGRIWYVLTVYLVQVAKYEYMFLDCIWTTMVSVMSYLIIGTFLFYILSQHMKISWKGHTSCIFNSTDLHWPVLFWHH